MIFFGEKLMRRAVNQWLIHYPTERNHQSLDDTVLQPGAEAGRATGGIERICVRLGSVILVVELKQKDAETLERFVHDGGLADLTVVGIRKVSVGEVQAVLPPRPVANVAIVHDASSFIGQLLREVLLPVITAAFTVSVLLTAQTPPNYPLPRPVLAGIAFLLFSILALFIRGLF